MWLHVDGAYGAFAALTERGREALAGLELADSVTLDPHKWLYQPFECGALLVRRGHLLKDAFEIHPSYLQDTTARDGATNYADHGLQLTRMSRALKIWMSLQYFGVDAFAAAIDRAMDLAEHAQRVIEAAPDLELLAPATLGIVGFRRHPPGRDDEEDLECANATLINDLAESGEGLVSSTRLSGRYAIRLCVLNHGTTTTDVDRVLDWLQTATFPDVAHRGISDDRPRGAGDQDRRRRCGVAGTGRGRRRPAPLPTTPRGPRGGSPALGRIRRAATPRRRRARRSCASGRSTGTSTCSSRVTPTCPARAAT